MRKLAPQNKNAPGRLSKVLTAIRVNQLGLALSSLLVLSFMIQVPSARADSSCQLVFSRATPKVWKPSDPLQFGEIITSLNPVKSIDKDTSVSKDSATHLWRVQAKANSVSKFVLELLEPLRTSEQLQEAPYYDMIKETRLRYFPHQDVGNGLVLKLKSNQKDFRLRLRLHGKSNESDIPFSAVADIEVSNKSGLIKIPWDKFIMENTLTQTPTALLNFKSTRVENYYGEGLHADLVSSAPLDQPYLVKAGASFEPALLDIRKVSFEVTPNDSSQPMQLVLGESLYRDFSIDYLTKNRVYLEHALQMMLQMQGGKDFLPHVLKKYKDSAAIRFALETVNQGPEKIQTVLESYGFRMIEIPDRKVSVDEFFTKYLGSGLIPIEQGAFAKHHGRYTHVAQLLTLLHGSLTTTEANMATNSTNVGDKNIHRAQYIRMVMDGMTPNSGPKFLWRNVWNIFFDAPGAEGPNTPLWWVDQFKKHKVLVEPAALP